MRCKLQSSTTASVISPASEIKPLRSKGCVIAFAGVGASHSRFIHCFRGPAKCNNAEMSQLRVHRKIMCAPASRRRGLRHLRYADDCNIYVRSERAGRRVMANITRFITHKLKLKVTEAKSAVARPQERKFLGFSFSPGPEIKRLIAPKALERFKHRIREVTRRAKGVSMESTIEELAPYLRGWRSYFGLCEPPEVLIYPTRWVRLRLRAALWRQWKTPRRRRAALLELGVRPRLANNTASSGRGPWYLARAKALSVELSNAYLQSLGLPTLIDGC